MSETTYTYDEAYQKSLEYFEGDELAAKVFVDKYALRNDKDEFVESNPSDTHKRLAKEFARIEKKYPNSMTEEEIYSLFDKFKYIIPQGSPMSAIGNPYQIQSAGNCFSVPSPYDSYGGIFFTDQQLAQLMKRRCGAGVDISTIRPKGLGVKNAAKTTDGIAIFAERFSNTCREVAQSGRRGALIEILDVRHPEILTFINLKRDLKKVTGANISIKVTDEFMNAVREDKEFTLRWPVESDNPVVSQKIMAREIWDAFIDSNFTSAEPGILYWDTVKRRSVSDCYGDIDKAFRDTACNPCITGETLIYLADGRGHVSIRQLKEEGKDVPVFCYDDQGKLAIRKMRNPRVTGYNKKIYKVTLEGGCVFRATANHKMRLSDGSYKEVGELTNGDYIKSLIKFEESLTSTNESSVKTDKETGETADNYSHKVIKIEEDGYEDVYNGTVDDFHNYFIGGFDSRGENGKKEIVYINCRNCGEIVMGEDSCRLISINLYSFVENKFTPEAYFDYEKFADVAYKGQRLMDDLVDIEIELIEGILKKIKKDPEPEHIKKIEYDTWKNFLEICKKGRRTGLGALGLADVLASLGLRYGSDEAIAETEKIYKTLSVNAYKSTCTMAQERGSFPVFDFEVEKGNEFIKQVLDESKEVYELYHKYGRRNIALTTTAPTGSTAILAQVSAGIEPIFSLEYMRRKKINPDSKNSRVDFVDQSGDSWQVYKVMHKPYAEWREISQKECYEESPYYKSTVKDIDWEKSVDIQAAAQKWICHSVSKTCNVTQDTTPDIISKVYMRAFEKGCKGFTVYREGSRSGVIVSEEDQPQGISKTNAPKRPKSLMADIYHTTVKGETYFVIVGLYKNDPYEIFAGKNGDIQKSLKKARIVKQKRGVYALCKLDSEEILHPDVSKYINDEEETITRLISSNLRHGCDVAFVVHQLEKTEGDMISFTKAVARILKKYIPDDTEIKGENCIKCGGTMVRFEGCGICRDCGHSKCS